MNLFLIGAPYQVLNALEAIHYLKLNDNHLRIIDTGHFTRAQFDSVIDSSRWVSVRFHNFRYLLPDCDFGFDHPPTTLKERFQEVSLWVNQALKRLRANHIARGIGSIDHLVLGNYRRDYDGHMRHLANRLRFKRLLVLDVGTDTLRVNYDRHVDKEDSVVSGMGQSGFNGFKHWIKRRFVEWDTRGVESLTFFTVYDLDPVPGDVVIRNSYDYLQSVVANARPTNKVLFVGGPFVDQSYITRETFFNLMSRIKVYFDGQDLVYIPHPRESKNQLQVIRDLGITMQRFAAPFEYAVSFSGERPRGIAAFFSSVMENSAEIFGSTVGLYAFRLPEALLLKDHASIRQVYDQLATQSGHIEVVDLIS